MFPSPVSADFGVEFLEVCSSNGEWMFDSDASNVVEDCRQFVTAGCFQYCQLVVWLPCISHRAILQINLS